jgi:hypothetical protein
MMELPPGTKSRPQARFPGVRIWLTLVLAAAYLYGNLFRFPFTPALLSDDQVFFWMHAQRMLNGERPYIDFFQYTPPGTDLFFLSLFKLFGPHIWVLNFAVLVLGVALCGVCFWVSQQVMQSDFGALAALFYLVFIFCKPLNATHHWFCILILMSAVALLTSERTPRRIAIAGALLGLAFFFTHTHGVAALAAVATFLIWEYFHQPRCIRLLLTNIAIVGLSFAGCALALYAYFIATAGLTRLWSEQVTYVHSHAIQGFSIPNLGLPAPVTWRGLPAIGQSLFVYVLLPLVYLFSLYRGFRHGAASPEQRRIVLLSIVGLFLLVEVAFSPNWLRIYAISMPGIILAFSMLGRLHQSRKWAPSLTLAALMCLAALQIWSRLRHPDVVVELPAGTAAVPVEQHEELEWLAANTRPGEFLLQAAWPGVYVPLGLHNPLFLDAVGTNDQTQPEGIELAVRQLDERRVRYVLWSERLDAPGRDTREDHLGPLRMYLRNQYMLVKTFSSGDEAWQRK